ncbi:MAG: hypothetical protein AUK48_07270 [Oscillatoriales cyanobacterium CG2_30_44_21]|nr:MAG: hypothetical protein AUK48_07270 [Oscillatoriales cyanobacterium CG2_30_44_21]
MNNPALQVQRRNQPAAVIPTQQQVSILDWLESTGRLIAREGTESTLKFDDEAEELSELMLGDDPSYVDDDDDLDDDDVD